MRKGQVSIIAPVASLIFISVFVLVGLVVYGYASDATPHDKLYYNETICTTTCTPHTLYTLDHYPALNGSTLVCSNASGTDLLVWDTGNTSLGYHLTQTDGRYINLTLAGSYPTSYQNVRCDYTHNWATLTGQDEFWDSATATSYSGFILTAIIVIVIAASAVIGYVLLLRG